MKYTEFCQSIKAEVSRMMGESYSVRVETVVKNNQIKMDAIVITRAGARFSPMIYIAPFYREYVVGKNIHDISLGIMVQYELCRKDFDVDLGTIMDYRRMKERLYVKVINTGLNAEILKDMPYLEQKDLSMVVYADMENDGCSASMQIHNRLLDAWGITKEELFRQAIKNTRAYKPYKLREISQVMMSMLEQRIAECGYEEGEDAELDALIEATRRIIIGEKHGQMYVLSNKETHFGAVYMFFDDYMREIVDRINDDVFIIPCSVHEVILVPKSVCPDEEELKSMVRSVNENQLDPREVLSDRIYLYERGKGM